MGRLWRRTLHLLELARVELLLAAVSNVWLMTFLAVTIEPAGSRNLRLEELGLPLSLTLATLSALGLVGCGMSINDVVDARYDRQFAPHRPIPSGRVGTRAVVSAAMLSLIVALGAAVWLGTASAMLAMLAAIGILFYNATGRFIPAVGIVSLGLLTAMSMLIPNPHPAFIWPVALTMTHVMACATLRYALAGRRPRLSALDGVGVCMGWAFWVLLLVTIARSRGVATDPTSAGSSAVVAGVIWVGPILAMFGFVALSYVLLSGKTGPGRSRRVAATRFGRWSGLWLIVYDFAWLASAGMWWQAGAIAGLFVLAWLAMSLNRAWAVAAGPRPTYRV